MLRSLIVDLPWYAPQFTVVDGSSEPDAFTEGAPATLIETISAWGGRPKQPDITAEERGQLKAHLTQVFG